MIFVHDLNQFILTHKIELIKHFFKVLPKA